MMPARLSQVPIAPMPDTTESAFWRSLFCLVIALAGGLAMDFAGGPLPYMLGAVAATATAAMLGWPVARPGQVLVVPMRLILGVMIGSTVTQELVAQLGALGGGLLFVPLYVLLVALLGTAYYSRVAGFPRNEAFFCALPGGLYTMAAVAEDAGADVRRVSLAHALRISLVVLAIPLVVRLFADVEAAAPVSRGVGILEIPLKEMLLLTAAGLAGGALALKIPIPGALIVCPMLVSAAIHIAGISEASPPRELVIAAQLVLGAFIGARFLGERFSALKAGFVYAVGHVGLMMGISICIAFVLHELVGLPVITGVLAFAPGGLAEMSLVALGLGLDVGVVATLHVSRVLVIVVLVPLLYERMKGLFEPKAPDGQA